VAERRVSDGGVSGDPSIIVVTSPNNPTGAVATEEDVRRICEARPSTLVLVDAAYAEFGEVDLTQAALAYPNAIVIRTLSKAWGLAGLRVGYALGAAEAIGWLRAAGAPYPVSGPSLMLAQERLERGEEAMQAFVATAKEAREVLRETLLSCGVDALPSQGNFAFARVGSEARAVWLRDAMAGLGIGIRAFPGRAGLEDAVRISVPATAQDLERTCAALRTVLAPECWLLDLDGVVADVSESYRAAIVQTAATFGVTLDDALVKDAKRAGDANNDWILTQRMLAERGVEVPLSEVTATFEALVQGTPECPGLWQRERLLVARDVLENLRRQRPIAAVTGRPRLDAERFLETHGVSDLFDVVVCMEDAPAKPRPEPVTLALARLGVTTGWMVGDTPDDARAARAAGAVPLGVRSGGLEDGVLYSAGCARVFADLRALAEELVMEPEGVRCAG
jgi:HAD superfamily hydrolase (TIGR01548 family)